MFAMYVLDGDKKSSHYRVIMHFPVSGGNNSAGIPWQVALKSTNPTTVLPIGAAAWEISEADKLLIEDGRVLEYPVTLDLEPGRDTVEKVSKALQRAYGRARTEARDTMARQLRWFGLTENEV